MPRPLPLVLAGVLGLAVLLPANSRASAPEPFANWSYHLGDSPPGADGAPAWARDDAAAGFQPMAPLASPPGSERETMLWYRLQVPAGEWRDPAIYFGQIQGAYELYSGGERILARGEIHPGGQEHAAPWTLRIHSIPTSALGHPLFVRVQSTGQAPNIRQFALVGDRADLVFLAIEHGMASFVLGFIALLLGAFVLALFAVNRQVPVLGWYGLFSVASGLMLVALSQLPGPLWGDSDYWNAFLYAGGALQPAALARFASENFVAGQGRRMRLFSWAFLVLGGVVGVGAFVLPGSALMLAPLAIATLGGNGMGILIAVLDVRAGRSEARPFLAGVLVLFAAMGHDWLQATRVGGGGGYWTQWGFFALIVSLAFILARGFAQLQKELEAHAKGLEERQTIVLAGNDRMRAGARELASAVRLLADANRSHNEAMGKQASTLEETRVTAEEIRQTSLLASERAQALLGKTAEADEAGKRGEAALALSVHEVEQIGGEVGEMARRISLLESRTREIAGIVQTVKGLADQSNMLALNAAIEAVRSGEHGKGFAVVAREVRSLADQSIQATSRIRTILESVETGIREVSELSGRGEERVRQSVGQVRQTADELRRMSEITRETNGSVRQISAAVSQQNAGIAQIFTAVSDLAEQMREAVLRVEETDRSIAAVDRVARSLTEADKEAAPAASRAA